MSINGISREAAQRKLEKQRASLYPQREGESINEETHKDGYANKEKYAINPTLEIEVKMQKAFTFSLLLCILFYKFSHTEVL